MRRTGTTVVVRERVPEGQGKGDAREEEAEYEVLNILEFTSARRRMSVVVRSLATGRLLLYCKGADSAVYERLAQAHPLNERLKGPTLSHLEEYGSAGLRTLCLAYRELDEADYDAWQDKYIEAKTSLRDRDAKVDAASELIERDLVLLGCTAIEDKLQEGVPGAIRQLAAAGVALWVLTGQRE